MATAITKVSIRGFRSIRRLENFELRPVNVLIGANGAGKSNFAYFFHFISQMLQGQLPAEVERRGGADRQLYLGPQTTPQITADLVFSAPLDFRWSLGLSSTDRNTIMVDFERTYQPANAAEPRNPTYCANLVDLGVVLPDGRQEKFPEIKAYHFSDTAYNAPPRRYGTVRNPSMAADGSNIAAFLSFLRSNAGSVYYQIRDTVRLVAPFFDDFVLTSKPAGDDIDTWLDWKQCGSDYPFLPNQLSDGTLRFICLVATLLQPNLPELVVLDEPELGLHPHALGVLAALIKSAATRCQIIVCTQSAALLDEFEPADVIVAQRQGHATELTRLDPEQLKAWLENYSLGELWRKNFLPGGGM